jgi:hypothetical protein
MKDRHLVIADTITMVMLIAVLIVLAMAIKSIAGW